MDIPSDEREVSDLEFIRSFDLTRPGLRHIRQYIESGELSRAKRALVEYFKRRARPRWSFDLRDGRRGKIFSFWYGHAYFSEDDATLLHRVDSLLKNRFILLDGFVRQFGKDLKWRTKEMLWRRVPGNALRRGEFFRDLAVAYARTGRPAYAAKFGELVERWLEDWPLVVDPDFGPTSGIFCRAEGRNTMPEAFRVINWLDALYSGIVFAPQVPEDTAFRLIKSLSFTALQYRRYEKSPYRRANHHLWERGTTPFIFGLMLPEIPEIARLLEQGRKVVAAHAERSFHTDGGYEERSANYTLVALSMFFIAIELARINRVPLLDRKQKVKVKRAAENMARLGLPHGRLPDIGDGETKPFRYGRFLGQTARLFKSRVAAEVVKRLHLKKYADSEDRRVICALKARALPLTVHYPASGYFVARDGWSPRASAMALSVPGSGWQNHIHDDALSLHLIVRGIPFVGTPMTELYRVVNTQKVLGTSLHSHHYTMPSHNVVLVGGEPAHPNEAQWYKQRREPTAVKASWQKTSGGVCVSSTHKAYPGVKVLREVVFSHRKGWKVTDRVQGARGKPHILRWHFEYGVDVIKEAGGGFVAERDGIRLSIHLKAVGKMRKRLYRDTRWLGKNPLRPGEPAPWVLDVAFGPYPPLAGRRPGRCGDPPVAAGGTGADVIQTQFEIMKSKRS